jgi:uncharacterized protein (TIGR02996 family)
MAVQYATGIRILDNLVLSTVESFDGQLLQYWHEEFNAISELFVVDAVVTVDATKPILAKAAKYRKYRKLVKHTRNQMTLSRTPNAGKMVRYGDKVGLVTHYQGGRCRVEIDSKSVLVDSSHVQVIEPEQYMQGKLVCSLCYSTTNKKSILWVLVRGVTHATCLKCYTSHVLEGNAHIRIGSRVRHPAEFITPPGNQDDFEDGFLRAIAQNQDNTTDWLIYADYLEERGWPMDTQRAELIRRTLDEARTTTTTH